MKKPVWIDSRSGTNRKSKIQNLKWARFLTILVLLVGGVGIAQAQQPKKVPRIGFLSGGSPTTNPARIEAFRQGLRELGYVEGKNIVIEWRYAEGKLERLPDLAADLVRLRVDVILAGGGNPTARVAKKATQMIPIVMTNVSDPVGSGLIASLARPGGNITGLTGISSELTGKRLELLRETVPKVSRIGVLLDPGEPAKVVELKETQAAARALGVQLQSLEVRSPTDFESAFKAATGGRANALIVLQSTLTNAHRTRIVELATKSQLPTMWAESGLMDTGGLMSYGPNYADLFRRAATYVDKILRGTKPADLPVEQPMKFELVINLKAAKQIGLTIPPNVLARADKVIK